MLTTIGITTYVDIKTICAVKLFLFDEMLKDKRKLPVFVLGAICRRFTARISPITQNVLIWGVHEGRTNCERILWI